MILCWHTKRFFQVALNYSFSGDTCTALPYKTLNLVLFDVCADIYNLVNEIRQLL
ncbi:hypothetical protein V6Z12_A02G142700 [Gossypium hirsutum]